jgi:hypothetical protein
VAQTSVNLEKAGNLNSEGGKTGRQEYLLRVFPSSLLIPLHLPQRGTVPVGSQAGVVLESVVEVGDGLDACSVGDIGQVLEPRPRTLGPWRGGDQAIGGRTP